MLARVLFKALQTPLLSAVHISVRVEELASLLSHLHHVCWWLSAYRDRQEGTRGVNGCGSLPEHLNYAGYLVVLTCTGEERKAKKELNSDAAQ